MKKIAVITPGFSGSTIPLEKYLVHKGISIEHYQIVHQFCAELESFPFKFHSYRFGDWRISYNNAKEIYDYVQWNDYSLNVLNLPRPLPRIPIINHIMRMAINIVLYKFCKKINKKYDVVLFFGQYNDLIFHFLVKNIKKEKIVALHEVCNHRKNDFDILSPLMKEIKQQELPIVVFSRNSYNSLLKYNVFSSKKIFLLHFGLFEGYSLYHSKNTFKLPSEYVLYIGSISHHKGLDIFYDAVVSKDNWPCKFVVAGRGFSEYVEKMKKDKRFLVINHFLTNSEFAELVRNCKFVVCPYRTMSQSGIPQTAFLFDKPVVASDLDGFKEIIVDKDNGLLFESENKDALQKSMKELLENAVLYNKIKDRINFNFSNDNYLYSWNVIANEYIINFFYDDKLTLAGNISE